MAVHRFGPTRVSTRITLIMNVNAEYSDTTPPSIIMIFLGFIIRLRKEGHWDDYPSALFWTLRLQSHFTSQKIPLLPLLMQWNWFKLWLSSCLGLLPIDQVFCCLLRWLQFLSITKRWQVPSPSVQIWLPAAIKVRRNDNLLLQWIRFQTHWSLFVVAIVWFFFRKCNVWLD